MFRAKVTEARPLGEITPAALSLADVSGTRLRLTLSGPQRLRFTVGEILCIRLDLDLVHVMPLRRR